MEEPPSGLGPTLAPQQWAGFDRFKEVQEILDRNKCGRAAARCRPSAALKRDVRLQAAHQRNQRQPRVQAVRAPRACALDYLPSLTPPAQRRDDLQRNVVLIRELNLNIGKVVELYRELSVRCGCACVLVSQCASLTEACRRKALSVQPVTQLSGDHGGMPLCDTDTASTRQRAPCAAGRKRRNAQDADRRQRRAAVEARRQRLVDPPRCC